MGEPVFEVSDQVRHNSYCTTTEDIYVEARNFGFTNKRDCIFIPPGIRSI